MTPASRMLTLAATLGLALPAAALAQQGALPWRVGDPPPAVAGLRLGAARSAIDATLGPPEAQQVLSKGVTLLRYPSRRMALVYSDADSLAVIYVGARDAADLGGVRVGDPGDSVMARWGAPTQADGNISLYQVGRWAILVRLDTTRTSVELLGLARVVAPPALAGPFDSTAQPRDDIAAALRQAQSDHKLVLVDFGANWCYDCVVLERLLDDSTVAGYLAANFHVVRVDVGNFNRNLGVDTTYGDPIKNGIPSVVVLSPTGGIVATTKDGSLENARSDNAAQILRYLQTWVAASHR